VAYVYSETREGDLLHTMLKDFKGVLVSDFYAAYDSIHCPQCNGSHCFPPKVSAYFSGGFSDSYAS